MVEKFLKFIEKSQYKNVLLKTIFDIKTNNLSWYDVKTFKGVKWAYRIRKWDVRIIFKRDWEKVKILKVDNRWDVYK